MFLLINSVKDIDWIKKEVVERFDFKNRFSKLIKEINSKQFKDGLQGVFGVIDNKIFERNVKLVNDLSKS